jgi:hypothetical protein
MQMRCFKLALNLVVLELQRDEASKQDGKEYKKQFQGNQQYTPSVT